MIDFLKRLFGQSGSSSTAKERLRLVLMTDHLELSPEMIESMKRDLVDVISCYVEVDRDKIEVNFEQQDRALAMLANIPILSVNRPNGNGTPKREEPTPTPALEPESASIVASAPNVTSPGAEAAAGAIPTRKRRRRKKAQSLGSSSPNPTPA